MIDRTKFLEPTERYIKENTLSSDRTPNVVKDWYNIDLIFLASQYKNGNYHQAVGIQMAFDKFREFYDVELTMEEIDKLFGEYPKDCFDELLKELLQKEPKN